MKRVFLLISGTLVALLAAGALITHGRDRTQAASGATTPTISGNAHQAMRVVRNQSGLSLAIDDVIVGSDRITVLYKVTGVSPIDFSQINANPVFAREGPTLLTITVDGVVLRPLGGTTGGETQSSTISGEESLHWTGGRPRHFHIVVGRIMGDTRANFVADFDLEK